MPLNNITKIALITFFSSLYFYIHANFLYMQERGLTLFQANSIWAVIIGTLLLAEVPTGVIADRIGRKNSVVAAMALQLSGEVIYLFARNYAMFVFTAVLAGIGFAFLSGCVEALIYESLPEENREHEMKRAMGINGMAHNLAFVAAPIVGAYLVPLFTMERFLLAVGLTAASVAIALLLSLMLVEPSTPMLRDDQTSWGVLRDGFQHLIGNRLLIWLALIGIFTSSYSGSLSGLYQPYFTESGLSSYWMGWGFAGASLLGALCARYAYVFEEVLGQRWGFAMTCLLPGFLYLLLAVSSTPLPVFLLFVGTYGSMALRNPLLSAYQNGLIQSENRATVLSLLNLSSLWVVIMTLVIGWGSDVSLSWTFGLIGVLILAGCVALRVDRVGVVVPSSSSDEPM